MRVDRGQELWIPPLFPLPLLPPKDQSTLSPTLLPHSPTTNHHSLQPLKYDNKTFALFQSIERPFVNLFLGRLDSRYVTTVPCLSRMHLLIG
jgi:hypothetical protein